MPPQHPWCPAPRITWVLGTMLLLSCTLLSSVSEVACLRCWMLRLLLLLMLTVILCLNQPRCGWDDDVNSSIYSNQPRCGWDDDVNSSISSYAHSEMLLI